MVICAVVAELACVVECVPETVGSGAQHMRVFQRLVCGVWQPTSVELLKPIP